MIIGMIAEVMVYIKSDFQVEKRVIVCHQDWKRDQGVIIDGRSCRQTIESIHLAFDVNNQ